MTTLRGWFKRRKVATPDEITDDDAYLAYCRETPADVMWASWGYPPIDRLAAKPGPTSWAQRQAAGHAEFARWRKSHRDWLVIRAVNAVLDNHLYTTCGWEDDIEEETE